MNPFDPQQNIHVMRSSLSKLMEACELKTPSMAAFISGVHSSGWLRHIHAILDTSLAVARSLEEGVNVLVHCSDGCPLLWEINQTEM